MHYRRTSLLAFASVLLLAAAATAQDVITVDTTSVVADVSRKPIGINVNFLLDNDANRANAMQDLAQALKAAGVKYLRYPGGEKSDAFLWSVPPYTHSASTLARWAAGEWPANQEWPSYDRTLVETDGYTFKTAPLDFDEFMTVCRAIDCIPTIVICYDSMYKPAQTGGVAPTRAQLLETAREWVRYANITKRYGIKYWEIGNETWQPHYNGSATATNYARDLIDFSTVMKAVDPSIKIGANGESDAWWRTILTTASGAIDFLAVHNYPAYNWGSYTYYKNNSVNLMGVVQAAQRAIDAYAPAADRTRLMIASTEINTADWSGTWPHINDTGHAIALFDLFGAHLTNPRIAFTQLWNTRWSGNDTATTPALWDALDKQNELQGTGRAVAVWGQFLKDTMVSSSSTALVRSYSSYSPSTRRLTVFLINKDTAERAASVSLKTGALNFSVGTWTFTGDSAQDVTPSWTYQGQSSHTGNVMSLTLAPVSVTVLDIVPDDIIHSVPGTIQAEDFRNGGYSDTTAGNSGAVYRATDVDLQSTSDAGGGFNLAWISAGEWLDYTIQVQRSGFYDLSARVGSPYANKSLRMLVDGQDVTGKMTVPDTGGWQKWQTVTHTGVYLTAGTHRATVSAVTDGFNVNWVAFTAAAGPTHALPGIIEAEDFRDDTYWDSTPGNEGATYRVTNVDVQPDADGGFNVGWIAAGEWLEYTVRVQTAGHYDLAARVASPVAAKSFRVMLNGADLTGGITVPNTGAWQNWRTVTRTNVYLPAGTHRVRFVAITDGFNFNWLSFAPSIGSAHILPGVIEAEDFDEAGFWDSTTGNLGDAYRDTDVDIQRGDDGGSAFNVGWISAGEWLEFTVQLATAGDYDLSARVASPHTGKTFRVLLNGNDLTGSITVPNTGAYTSWQTVTRTRLYLPAGTHRLRFVAVTNGFNLNWLSLQTTR